MVNKDIVTKLSDLNKDLIDELLEVKTDVFVSLILSFINDNLDMSIKQFSYVEDINVWLDSIEIMKSLIEFNKTVNDDLTNSFICREFACDTYFIKEEDFVEFIKNLALNDEEIIELNKYLMNCLYK